MAHDPPRSYLHPTQQQGRDFFVGFPAETEVVMLNLLRFREVADYTADPQLAPAEEISGAKAYRLYMKHTAPFLEEAGGRCCSMGMPLLL